CTHPPLPSFPPRRSSDLTTCNVQRVTDSMAQIVSLAASPRQAAGKGAARQVRLQGKVPAVIYGHGRETQALEVGAKALEKALTGVEPQNTIIEVLPEHIPDRVELDVTALKIGASLHVRDLSIPDATILTSPDLTMATVVPPRAEEVAAPTPETAAEVAEPELIRKVREGEEEEGEGGAATEGGAPAKPEAKGGGGAAPAKGEKTEKAEKPKGGKES